MAGVRGVGGAMVFVSIWDVECVGLVGRVERCGWGEGGVDREDIEVSACVGPLGACTATIAWAFVCAMCVVTFGGLRNDGVSQ
jgi:hypothetical protein